MTETRIVESSPDPGKASGRDISPGRVAYGIGKVAVSCGFIWTALASGATGSPYGRAVLAALALSWVGDAALVGRSRPAFLTGLVSFALAHVAYIIAFAFRGLSAPGLLAAGLVAAAVGIPVGRWLEPHVPDRLRTPVRVYLVLISLMTAAAVSTVLTAFDAGILTAGLAFYLSDLSVARERFVAPGIRSKFWGLPLYYLAQFLLALSVSG